MNNIISVKNLTKEFKVKKKQGFLKDAFLPKYKKVKAVDNISFEIKKGESVAFLGPNGAGKTTTTKMLTGLIYPTSGKINVLNYFPFDRKRDFLMRIGLVMGNKQGLDWDLTANQSFDLLKQIYRIPEKDFNKRVKRLTELLDVTKFLDKQVRKLSLGERLKLEIIAAILHNPEVLFLDEPTIGLDIISKHKIRNFLREIQKESNITILLTSHDMDDIEKVCDRVIVINEGKKIYDNSLPKLTASYNKAKYIKFIFNEKPTKSEFQKIGKNIIEEGENFYLVKTKKERTHKVISEVSEKFDMDDIDIVSVPFEEIIADVFNGKS